MTAASRPFLWLLLAAALFVRAFVPQGYMPERSDGGAIAVAVCGSGGVHVIPLGKDGEREKDRPRPEPPCAFAGLSGAALPPPAAAELPAPQAASIAYAAPARAFAAQAPPRLFPPARGPPLPA